MRKIGKRYTGIAHRIIEKVIDQTAYHEWNIRKSEKAGFSSLPVLFSMQKAWKIENIS
jgi:hypothetical protein